MPSGRDRESTAEKEHDGSVSIRQPGPSGRDPDALDKRPEGRQVEEERPHELDRSGPPVVPVFLRLPCARTPAAAQAELDERRQCEEHRTDKEGGVGPTLPRQGKVSRACANTE